MTREEEVRRERALFLLGPQPWQNHKPWGFPWAPNPKIKQRGRCPDDAFEKTERQWKFTQRVRRRVGLEPKVPAAHHCSPLLFILSLRAGLLLRRTWWRMGGAHSFAVCIEFSFFTLAQCLVLRKEKNWILSTFLPLTSHETLELSYNLSLSFLVGQWESWKDCRWYM